MTRNEYEQENKIPWGIIITGTILFIAFIFIMMSVYTISAGYRGVLLTFGKPSQTVITEGIHWKIPIAQTVKKMEVRTQKIEAEATSASKDLQDVNTQIALNFHIDVNKVNTLYQEIGLDYKARIIDPAIQESVKAVTARFTAEELITRRQEVKIGIQKELEERLARYYITVDGFNIVDFHFSDEFNKAIEQKVTAEQLYLKAQNDLERVKVEADQKVAQAQAEATALRLQKQEITPDLIKLRQIEVQRAAIEQWDGALPRVNSGGVLPFIDINSETGI